MKRLIVMLAVFVVAVSACSGESGDTSSGDAPTSTSAAPSGGGPEAPVATTTDAPEGDAGVSLAPPCSYLTDTDMTEIVGKTVTSEASGDLLCIYAPGDGSGGIELLVQDVADVGCELVFSVGGFDDEEPVEGAGVYANYKASGVSQMAVCYDEVVALTMTMYAEPSDPKGVLTAVAVAVENGLS